MDAISYSYADKQAKRIKKFIENPDSNSGVLTQPKVIEAGETVTIKSGRQAILADTVVEGDLIIEAGGDVFVPAGATIGDLEDKIDGKAPLNHNHNASDINGLGTASTKNVGTTMGNVMEVGAFGLGSDTTDLPYGNLRLRTYWETVPNGFYWANNSQNQYPGAVATYCFYLVHKQGGHINVTAYPYNSHKMFLLHMANVQTTDAVWFEFLSTKNILTSTGQSTVYPMTQKAVTDAIQGVSDARDKFNIQNTNIGLELIEKLDVVTYNLNKRDWYRSEKATITEEIELEDGTKETITKIDDEILKSDLKKYDKNDGHLAKNSVYTGLIAQDVKEAYESLGLDLSIVKNMKDEYEGGDDRYYIEYNGLVPILINAIKELNNKVKSLEDRLNEQIPEGGN